MRRQWCKPRSGRCRPSGNASADRRWRTRSLRIARPFRKAPARSWSCWLENICSQLLERCLRGEPCPRDLLEKALEIDEGRAFLSIVVERLGDLFEPRLCDIYAELFTTAIEIV